MDSDEVIRRFGAYRKVGSGSYESAAIHRLALAILDGDIEKLREYQRAAGTGSYESAAIDTLTMALMDRTDGRGGTNS